MNTINPTRIRKALQAVSEAQRELEAALLEAETPRPDPLPEPAKIGKRYRSLRR
jgi:hypothetical protein